MLTSVCCVFVSMVQFALQEEKRQKGERLHQHQKHENQMRDLQLQCDSNIRELQQLQVELNALTFTLCLFMFTVYVLNYISMELQNIEQNTHNHVIHPSIHLLNNSSNFRSQEAYSSCDRVKDWVLLV